MNALRGAVIGTVTQSVPCPVTPSSSPTTAVTGYKAGNVQRPTSAAQPEADLVAKYPRVAAVKAIVDKALADAAVVGNQPVGKVTADITTAFAGSPAVRDDRASESTLGN